MRPIFFFFHVLICMPVCFKYSFDFNIFGFQSSSNFSYQYGSLALCQFSWCFGEIQFHWNTEAWSNHVRTDTNDLSASQNEGRRRRKCHFIWMFLRQQLSVKIISSLTQEEESQHRSWCWERCFSCLQLSGKTIRAHVTTKPVIRVHCVELRFIHQLNK